MVTHLLNTPATPPLIKFLVPSLKYFFDFGYLSYIFNLKNDILLS